MAPEVRPITEFRMMRRIAQSSVDAAGGGDAENDERATLAKIMICNVGAAKS
jgi:hypothetical protein